MFPKTKMVFPNSAIVSVKNVETVKKSKETSKTKTFTNKKNGGDSCSLEVVQVRHQQSRCQPPLPNRAMAFFDPDCDLFMRVAMNAYDEHLSELVPCSRCGRKFFPDRITRHESTCAADPIHNITPTPTKQKLPGGTQKRKSLVKK